MLSFLRVQKVVYKEIDKWKVEVVVEDGEVMRVEVNRVAEGMYMVKFAGCEERPAICRKILSFLRD